MHPHYGSFFAGPILPPVLSPPPLPSPLPLPSQPHHLGLFLTGHPATPPASVFDILLPPPSSLPVPLQQPLFTLPISHHPFDPTWQIHSLGAFNTLCSYCKALHWLDEQLINSSCHNPKFSMCCFSGKVSLPPLQPPPPELYNLLTSDQGRAFCMHIHNYNNALAMTLVGRKLDNSLNRHGGGPHSFRLHGELIHKAGSLFPPEGQPPIHAQLYICDSANALNHHMANT